MPAQGMRAAWRVAVLARLHMRGERNRAWRRSASDISLMGGIGPRRPCRASAKERQLHTPTFFSAYRASSVSHPLTGNDTNGRHCK
jgi:hypothetical protein